jgi:hypothetical protein
VIEKLAMGDIMQVKCETMEEAVEFDGMAWLSSQLGLTYLAIYISCCYFALATEIRLAIPETERDDPEHSAELRVSRLHHLHSIFIGAEFVLVESNYLSHIVRSFKNNFQVDLLADDIDDRRGPYQLSTSRLNDDYQESDNYLHSQKSDEGIQVDLGLSKTHGKLELNHHHPPAHQKISGRKHSVS